MEEFELEFEFGFEQYVIAVRRAMVSIEAGSLEEAKRKAAAMAESGEMYEKVRYELELLWDTEEEYYPGIYKELPYSQRLACYDGDYTVVWDNATNNQPTGDDDGKVHL